jgi:hypothetical protein
VRRFAVLAAPIAVPVSVLGVFALMARLFGPRRGYNAGFVLYWLGWCFAFPSWVVGHRGIRRLFHPGRRFGRIAGRRTYDQAHPYTL